MGPASRSSVTCRRKHRASNLLKLTLDVSEGAPVSESDVVRMIRDLSEVHHVLRKVHDDWIALSSCAVNVSTSTVIGAAVSVAAPPLAAGPASTVSRLVRVLEVLL